MSSSQLKTLLILSSWCRWSPFLKLYQLGRQSESLQSFGFRLIELVNASRMTEVLVMIIRDWVSNAIDRGVGDGARCTSTASLEQSANNCHESCPYIYHNTNNGSEG